MACWSIQQKKEVEHCIELCVWSPRYEESLITLRGLRLGTNFEVNVERAAIKAFNATWVSSTDSKISSRTEENHGNLDRGGLLGEFLGYVQQSDGAVQMLFPCTAHSSPPVLPLSASA